MVESKDTYFVSKYKDGFATMSSTGIFFVPTFDFTIISALYLPVFKPDLFTVAVHIDFFFAISSVVKTSSG